MEMFKKVLIAMLFVMMVSPAYAGDIGETKDTPQTDGTTIRTKVNHDGTVTVKHLGTDGKTVISEKKVKPGGGANLHDGDGGCSDDPLVLC
ncbi:MAG: hypothetical protein K0U40_03900 [Betaproteobacteria bacterium]|nr:hypothetical protein [Betaproteobacteria bacterium]